MSDENKKCAEITVVKGEEFKIKQISIKENEIFFDVFKQARDRLFDIINANQKITSDSGTKQYVNNIIAFCGERGQGKTSAMLSFTGGLKDKNNCVLFDEASNKNSLIKEYNYEILKPIDPTTLEEKDDIISNILAVLFYKFKKMWQEEAQHSNVNIERKNEILKCFNRCYKQINRIKKPKESDNDTFEDNLENLSERGESSNLKENLKQLIDSVLKYNSDSNKQMLVIQVDDTDLNINKAYEIVEDIRKYLVIPNVVIIMAVRLKQLSIAVEQQYRKDLSVMISGGERVDKYELQQMAERYIEKLIPNGRKINLPEISTSGICNSVDIKLKYIDEDKHKIIDSNDDNDLQDQVLKYVFDKTGIMLIHEEGKIHPLMPKTMRELVNLLAVLSKLPNLSSQEWDCEKRRHNLDVFQEYLLNTWMENNVDQGYIKYINDIKDIYDQSSHRIIITHICDIVNAQRLNKEKGKVDIFTLGEEDKTYEKLKEIINTKDYKHESDKDYSLGDVMDAIVLLDNLYPNQAISFFIAVLKILYTIKMFK